MKMMMLLVEAGSKKAFIYLLNFLAVLGLVFIGLSCSQSSDLSPIDLEKEYFPVSLQTYTIFEGQKVTYVLDQRPDSFYYQAKEFIADTFRNSNHDLVYVLERYLRYQRKTFVRPTTLSSNWVYDSTWSIERTENAGFRTESNQKLTKFIFPPVALKSWNGQSLTTLSGKNFYFKSVNKAYSIKNQKFPKTALVVLREDSNSINQDVWRERYAFNIGLIYKERRQYDDRCKFSNNDTCNLGRPNTGFILKESLLEHGNL